MADTDGRGTCKYLQLLVVLLVRVPGPPTLNVVTVDGLIDVARQVVQRHLGVAVNWPACESHNSALEHHRHTHSIAKLLMQYQTVDELPMRASPVHKVAITALMSAQHWSLRLIYSKQ